MTPPKTASHRWLHEPLLHFLIAGAMLFALDAWLTRNDVDPRVVTIDAAVDRKAIEVFEQARGRPPNEDELYALRRVWLDNEVLYREGLALQMDRGDDAIRDRVIFKALSMINAGLKLPSFDDDSLRAWFEANRVKYDEPPRFDFLEAVMPGAATQEAARELTERLQAGDSGDAQAGLRVFRGRPLANIAESYGQEFADALQKMPEGGWQMLPFRDGWRVIRLESRSASAPADYEQLRGMVLQDWTDTVMAEQRSAAVRALAQKYTIVLREAQP